MSIYIYFLVFYLLVGTCNDKQTALEFQLDHGSTSPSRVGEKHPILTILLGVGDYDNDSHFRFGEDALDFYNHSNVMMGQEGYSDDRWNLSAGGELKALSAGGELKAYEGYGDDRRNLSACGELKAYAYHIITLIIGPTRYHIITMIIFLIIVLFDVILLLTLRNKGGQVPANLQNHMRKIKYLNDFSLVVILYTSIWMQIIFPNPNVTGSVLLVGLVVLLGVSLLFLRLRYDFGVLDFVINMGSQYFTSEFLDNKYLAIPCFFTCCVVMVVRNHFHDITIYIITRFPTNGQEIIDGTGDVNQHNRDLDEREQYERVQARRGTIIEERDVELGATGRELNQGVAEAALNPGCGSGLRRVRSI